MSRRLRSILPNTHEQLQPEVVNHSDVYARRVQQQQHQKKYYDRSAHPMTTLQPGQSIRLQERGHWTPAVVIKPADTDRSYHVRTTEGREYRRNRLHLLDTNEVHSDEVSSDEHYTTPPAPQATGDTAPPTVTDNTPPNVTVPYQTRYGRTLKPRKVMDL